MATMMARVCAGREQEAWSLFLLFVIVLMTITGCNEYPISSSPVPTSTPALVPPRSIIHSTLPLQEVWRREVPKIYQYAGSAVIPSSTIFRVQGGTLYMVAFHPVAEDPLKPVQILALDMTNGLQHWVTEQMAYVESFAVGPEAVFVTSVQGIIAHDSATGKEKWVSNQPPPSHEGYTLSFDDSVLNFIIDSGLHYSYTQIDPQSGQVGPLQESDKVLTKIDSRYRYTWDPLDTLWLEDIHTNRAEQIISIPGSPDDPLREDNILIIPYLKQDPSGWQSVIVVDLTTKQTLWECAVCFASDIAVDNGNLYAVRQDGALVIYSVTTGKLMGTVEFSGGSKIDPNSQLYAVAAANGYVFLYFSDTQQLLALGPSH